MIYANTTDLETMGLSARVLLTIAGDAKVAALESASVVIDGYLANRFQLPLSQVGADIKRACVNIAVYDLLSVRGFSAGTNDAEQLRLRYQDSIDWLKSVAAGKVTPQYVVDKGGGDSTNVAAPPRFVYQLRANESGELVPTSSKSRGW